ncbi:MAG: antitermination protein [Roseibium sp.]|uniref:antitermination protein n=1 Tax=Roseibium sp. TaxID=1936156 RepID=UPI001B28808E|nr:antitermination protein [Roseibium sp.]MBO6508244.1 antitermination protein [Roseibium sp.]MBO6893392.1 antitermination protein [Roseibium sp.]MBO6929360.1 antitermination protein [Roseibium sp.]
MKKFAVVATSTIALALAGGFAMSGGTKADRELRRVDCQTITMFTPAYNKSAEDLCANYGGVAAKDATPSSEGLVILVRNQPVGGFAGENTVR